jgi:hypothetical protein
MKVQCSLTPGVLSFNVHVWRPRSHGLSSSAVATPLLLAEVAVACFFCAFLISVSKNGRAPLSLGTANSGALTGMVNDGPGATTAGARTGIVVGASVLDGTAGRSDGAPAVELIESGGAVVALGLGRKLGLASGCDEGTLIVPVVALE